MTEHLEDSVLGHVRNALQLVAFLRAEDLEMDKQSQRRMLAAIAERLQAAVRQLHPRTDQDDNG